MRLLIITQKVDLNDPAMGFFHRWLEYFAAAFEGLVVICLEEGAHRLPRNVRVFSLGKEGGRSRLKYVRRFFKYLRLYRDEYDAVFVHMTPVYVLLGFWQWRRFGKKVTLWHNHRQGGLQARLGMYLAEKVFYTSPQAYAARYPRAREMPVGVDTGMFTPPAAGERRKNSLLSLGRIAPVKRLETLIDAMAILAKEKPDATLAVVGSPAAAKDIEYERMLNERAKFLVAKGNVVFSPGVPYAETPEWYRSREVFVNLTPSGSFDKTILEAMACGTLPVAANEALAGVLPAECLVRDDDPRLLAQALRRVLDMPEAKRSEYGAALREYVLANHGMERLVAELKRAFA